MKPFYFFAVAAVVFPAGASAQQPASPVDESEAAFNGESYKMFPAKVQPVLTNLCANCHAKADHASGFKLVRVPDGFANPRETSRNVRATAKFLARENPALSPLLTKAITPHGGMKDPPLFARTHPAFKNLELWVHWASLPEGSPAPTAIPVAKPVNTAITVAQTPPQAMPAERPVSVEPAKLPTFSATSVEPAKPIANADDPFDPTAFNRVAHPAK